MKEKTSQKPSLLSALLITLFVFICAYFTARIIFLSFAQYNALEKFLATLFFLAEAFIMMQAFGYYSTIYSLNRSSAGLPTTKPLKEFPEVAILVPARHEPKNVLLATFTSLVNLDYPNKTVYFLDDSSNEQYRKEAEELAEQLGLKLFRRQIRHGAKAGIINDCLKTLTAKYVAVFDADQTPIAAFLSKTVPFLESDPKLAFVQTPQFYSNLKTNRISYASNMQQAVFYEYICEGKSSRSSMICCGTNVVFRREALVQVGGLDEETVTEDFATSIKFHILGWDSLYVNHVYTFGMAPENMSAYLKQQNRWAMGNVGVLKNVIGEFFKNPLALKPTQWFEYFITGSYYLIGWAYLLLVLCPMSYLFFNVPSFFMNGWVYAGTFVPYMLLSVGVYYLCMRQRNYSFKQVFKAYMLSFITLPIYMRASLNGLLGIKGTFQVTAKGKTANVSYLVLWPQLLLWVLSLSAVIWGILRIIYEHSPTIWLNVFWASYHLIIFSSVFYFNEIPPDPLEKVRKLFSKALFEYKIIKSGAQEEHRPNPQNCFSVVLKEAIVANSVVMCKVGAQGYPSTVFDARIIAQKETRFKKGFKTTVEILHTPIVVREHLKGLLK